MNVNNVDAVETSDDNPYDMMFNDITDDNFKESRGKIIVFGISDKEEESTINGFDSMISSILEELDDSNLNISQWPKFIDPKTSTIKATANDGNAVSATNFRNALSQITNDTPMFEKISLVKPFLPKGLNNEQILDYLDILDIPETKSESINESTFNGDDWTHNEKYDYATAVINNLLDNQNVKTGPTGNGDPIFLDMFHKNKLKELLLNIKNSSYKDLDKCLKQPNPKNKSIWNSIFKGTYSGYTSGLASKNKGNAFEAEFIRDFDSKYKQELEYAIGSKIKTAGEPKADGALNTKRPLGLKGNKLYVTPEDPEKVGSYVTDITIPLVGNKKLYLSLKYGNTVTFINCGIKNPSIFPEEVFIDKDASKIGSIGKAIIKMFGINTTRFIDSFDKSAYKPNSKNKSIPYNEVSTTKYVDLDSLHNFLRSVIGYGFILVHKLGNNVHYYDLRDSNKLDNFIGSIQSVNVKYPIPGTKKRIDIEVDTTTLNIKFNIRSKDGGFYPTHIMSDYIIK